MRKTGYSPEDLKTFALVGHRSAGKTTVGDACLFVAGVTRAMGRVDAKTSLLDHDPETRKRQMTLNAGFAWFPWETTMFQMIDTPGSVGLQHQTELVVANSDAFVLTVSAPDGVESGTEAVLDWVQKWKKPGICVLNKIDRAFSLDSVMDQLRASCLKGTPIAVQMPYKEPGGELVGVVDLIDGVAYRYAGNGTGRFSPEPIPERLSEEFRSRRERLIEAIALTDDGLLEGYLEYLSLDDADFREGLRAAVRNRLVLPVFLAVADQCIGVKPLLDFMHWAFPQTVVPQIPQESMRSERFATFLASQVDSAGNLYHILRLWTSAEKRGGQWVNGRSGSSSKVRKYFHVRGPRRSTAHSLVPGAIVAVWEPVEGRPGDTLVSSGTLWVNPVHLRPSMMTYALATDCAPKQLEDALGQLAQFDHAIRFGSEALSGRRTISGHSEAQLERAVRWIQLRIDAPIRGELPEVQYRETIKLEVSGIEGKHERLENGLVEEFGACTLTVAPGNFEQALQFEEQVDEEDIPHRFLGAVESGIRKGMIKGPSGGFPVMGLRVQCVGGDYDFMQSTEDHFQSAAERGLRLALLEGGTRILEPWNTLSLEVPQDAVGNVLADITQRRGRISGLEIHGKVARVRADAPAREVRLLAPRLDAITGGRGHFTVEVTHYAPLPDELVPEVVASSSNRRRRLGTVTAQGAQGDGKHGTVRLRTVMKAR